MLAGLVAAMLVAGPAQASYRDALPIGGEYRALVMFDGANGAFPRGGLVQAAGGAIYGTTSAGGAGKAGTIFELEPGNG
ncbi:MAG: choice-of-anchor tandem repeat GloVer-containing protein, partial [Nocardioides sp.]